jgi:hypothetical protein
MQRYVLSFGGESLIVKENAGKSHRGLTWAIISLVIIASIVAAMFVGGLFKNPTAGSSQQKPADVVSQLT